MWKNFQKNYRHPIAVLMILLMVMTNTGGNQGAILAAGENESALFLLDGRELQEAIQETERQQELFEYDSLQLEAEKNSIKKRYEKLLGKKSRSVYALNLEMDDSYAPEGAELQSFYNTATKDVIFLFLNKSDMTMNYRINIDGYETEAVSLSSIAIPLNEEKQLVLQLSRHGAAKVFASLGTLDDEGNGVREEMGNDSSEEKETRDNVEKEMEIQRTEAKNELQGTDTQEIKIEETSPEKIEIGETAPKEVETEETAQIAQIEGKTKETEKMDSRETETQASGMPKSESESISKTEEEGNKSESASKAERDEKISEIKSINKWEEIKIPAEIESKLEESRAGIENEIEIDESDNNNIIDIEGQLLEDDDIKFRGNLKGKEYDTVRIQDDIYAKAVKVEWKDIESILGRQVVEYAVSYSVNLPEAAKTEGADCVAEGENLHFAVGLKEGYEIEHVLVNGVGMETIVGDSNWASNSNWASASNWEGGSNGGSYPYNYVVEDVSEDLEIEIEVKRQKEIDRQEWTAANNLKELHKAFNNHENKIYLTENIETVLDWDNLDDGDYGWAISEGTDITLDLNGHTLTYGGEGNGYFRLFYIRGTLTIMDSAGGGRITTSREEIDSAICVDGGKLIIESGLIGTFYESDDIRAHETGHGVVVKGQGVVCMKGGCIAGNGNGLENGGGIYVESGILEISGGSIEHNIANNGGGVYGTESSVIHITGGTISNNESIGGGERLSGYDFGGGGIFARGELIFTDGIIKENTAVSGGGGIYYDTIDFDENKSFAMTGGIIDNNVAEKGEGGGIYFGWHGTVTGGKITENHTNTKIDWGGGGIFTQTGVEVTILNAQITDNTADGFGGGVAGCPSGNIYALTIDGAGIFDNHAKGTTLTEREEEDGRIEDQSAKVDMVFMTSGFADYYCEKTSTVFGNMLGGGDAKWHGSSDGNSVIISKNNFVRADKRMGLNSCPSPEDKIRARTYANVIISGNTSHTHGGGIMSNGTLVLGSDIEMVDISGSKIWRGDQKENRPASIIINLLANGDLCASKEIMGEEDKWEWSFDEIPKTNVDGSLISYTVEEAPVFGYETEIKGSDNWFSIINTYIPERTSRTVRKIWCDSDNQKGKRPESIQVQLMADGIAEGDIVVLSAENQWSYTWQNLLQKEGDKDIHYTVVEIGTADGYATTYSEDTFTITNTLTNSGKPGSGSRPSGSGKFENVKTPGGPGVKNTPGDPGRITAVPMEGVEIPLEELLSEMAEEWIEDPNKPLAALAKTGDNRSRKILLLIFGMAGAGILFLIIALKREKEVQ